GIARGHLGSRKRAAPRHLAGSPPHGIPDRPRYYMALRPPAAVRHSLLLVRSMATLAMPFPGREHRRTAGRRLAADATPDGIAQRGRGKSPKTPAFALYSGRTQPARRGDRAEGITPPRSGEALNKYCRVSMAAQMLGSKLGYACGACDIGFALCDLLPWWENL